MSSEKAGNIVRLSGDVVVLPEAGARWTVMNVFAHTCLGVESPALEVLSAAEEATPDELQARFADKRFRTWEIGRFSNYESLLADPTRYVRDVNAWPEAEELDAIELVSRFEARCLLVRDETAYRSRFAAKTSLLDAERFGNFHQQLGQELIVTHRQAPSDWWVHQKFTDDMQQVRNNLYRAVQESFLGDYFARTLGPGDVVVDIGCGTGYYSNLMARTGASVLGIDPDAEYIALANRHAAEGARFETVKVSQPGAMDSISSGSVDYVFMTDALLFYFVPIDPRRVADIEILFSDIYRILKPDGAFISVEPHYVFWLLPWLGDADRPFTVISEYIHKTYGVVPSVSQLVQAYAKGGFSVHWMEELLPDPSFESVDKRAYFFASQFPLWQLFELKKTRHLTDENR